MPCKRGHDDSEWIPKYHACRICRQENSAKSYAKHREKRIQAGKERRERYGRGEVAKTKPCSRCGSMDKGRDGRCKPCQSKYKKEWRKTPAGQESQKKNTKYNRDRFGKLLDLNAKLKNNPCMDCGHEYPTKFMHWDHRPGEEKLDNVADLIWKGKSEEALLAEIEKCDLVCAKCHAQRSIERGQSLPYGGRGAS